jgi:hypothetical protein
MAYNKSQIAANAAAYKKAKDAQKYAREHLTDKTHNKGVVNCDYDRTLSRPVFILADGRADTIAMHCNAVMFPAHYDDIKHTCVMCSSVIKYTGPLTNISVNVGAKYHGYACDTCYASLPAGKQLCSRTIEPTRICAKMKRERRQMITLCLRQLGPAACRDIRKVILQMCMEDDCDCM